MFVTVSDEEGRVTSIEVDDAELIENVKALLEVEFNIPLRNQYLMYNGQELHNGSTLAGAGVKPGDLLLVRKGQPAPATAQELENMTSYEGLTWSDIPNNINPNLLHKILKGNARLLKELEHMNPKMHAAASKDDPAELRGFMIQQQLNRSLARREEAMRAQRLNSNPFDVEGQKQIEEEIRRRNIESNLEMAMEHMPEAFTRVTMLYVDAEVNGIPLKAFIDSGAQTTIMSKKCAQRCGVMRLVDTRFAGQAVGVGTARIIGKIHMASLKLGHVYLQCSFTVLDQDDMDFLFGLDMLKRHQCVIDLKANCLRITGGSGEMDSVPFLADKDIPDNSFGHGRAPASAGSGSGPQSSAEAGGGGGGGSSSGPPAPSSGGSSGPAPSPGQPRPAGAASGPPASTGADSDVFEALRGWSMPGMSSSPAPAPAATGTASTAPQGTGPSSSEADEEKIARILGLGNWTRAQVLEALTVTSGNEDQAVNYLLSSYPA